MATQEVFRNLDLSWYGSKRVFCGGCFVRRPSDELRIIAKAGGLHFEIATFNLRDFDTVDVEPGTFSYLDVEEALGRSESFKWRKSDKQWKRERLHKLRTGVLFEVRRNAPRIDHDQFAAEVAERQPPRDPKQLDHLVKEQLGHRRTTANASHLALVRLDDHETASLLTCWNCGTMMSVGRERLVMAVEHVKQFGGDILLSLNGIEVRDSTTPFEVRPHNRKKRPSLLPPPFRR
jgi:hypothetical protein